MEVVVSAVVGPGTSVVTTLAVLTKSVPALIYDWVAAEIAEDTQV